MCVLLDRLRFPSEWDPLYVAVVIALAMIVATRLPVGILSLSPSLFDCLPD